MVQFYDAYPPLVTVSQISITDTNNRAGWVSGSLAIIAPNDTSSVDEYSIVLRAPDSSMELFRVTNTGDEYMSVSIDNLGFGGYGVHFLDVFTVRGSHRSKTPVSIVLVDKYLHAPS
jgi:hypothetical protein